jgi:hypothetical protein
VKNRARALLGTLLFFLHSVSASRSYLLNSKVYYNWFDNTNIRGTKSRVKNRARAMLGFLHSVFRSRIIIVT